MITIIAKLKVKAGNEEAMKEIMKEAAEQVRANEPGNLAYSPHQSQADPTVFIFYERYKDQAALENHRNQEHYKNLARRIGGILDGAPEIDFYKDIE